MTQNEQQNGNRNEVVRENLVYLCGRGLMSDSESPRRRLSGCRRLSGSLARATLAKPVSKSVFKFKLVPGDRDRQTVTVTLTGRLTAAGRWPPPGCGAETLP